MNKMTLTWGWQPPQFEKMSNGNIRVFYYSKSYTENVEHHNPETGEVEAEERTSWRCNVVELNDKYLNDMIRENPESIECQKRLLFERITAYDSSDHVNSFSIGGVHTWIDKATRVGLKLRFEAEKRLGKTETTLWQNGKQFPLPLEGEVTALDMLDGIELYASTCYDVTQKHLAAINTLTSVEEVKNYDYLEGYPEKLSF
jgi:hypothetical protein